MATKKNLNPDSVKRGNTPWLHKHPEIFGLFLLAFVICQILSLISFKELAFRTNWMGWIGHVSSLCWYYTLGLASWWVLGICLVAGWKLLVHSKSILHRRNQYAFLIMTASLCLLLAVFESQFPEVQKNIALWIGFNHYPPPFHLSGYFVHFWYSEVPFVNLKHALNNTGSVLISILGLTIGLGILSEFSFIQCIHSFREWWKKRKEKTIETLSLQWNEASSINTLTQDDANSKNGARLVKLRAHAHLQDNDDVNATEQNTIAIQPELNLKTRPSVSRKEGLEVPSFFSPLSPSLGIKGIEKTPLSLKEKEERPFKGKPSLTASQEKRQGPNSTVDKRSQALKTQAIINGDYAHYQIPTAELLTEAKKIDTSSLKKDLKRKAEVLEETLLSFGIEAKVGQINYGPSITSFEVHPAVGVKVQRIKAVENDIALNLEAKSIRIIAPIPGKAAVGIEVPNTQPQEVSFKEILLSYQQSKSFKIPILLGKAVNGEIVMSDLTKMPHCIIAGATGSGKSVCINTIVMSILMNAKPDEIRLLMVDPKKVELTPYSGLPHMLAPVITEPAGACNALNWLVKEMELRYEILKITGQRNIESFNHRSIDQQFEGALEIEIPQKMAYYVAIIDELADLMMISSHDIETPIARIAQMARAVGIHLILATQRPSREVITGLIKANFPARICFKVAARINSQIVLDETGAESLLGNGDMLFLPPGTSSLLRTQGAYVRDEDINSVIRFITDQAPAHYLIQSFDAIESLDMPESGKTATPIDTLFEDAKEIVLLTNSASTTFLQRKLKIGYARAASLMDELEAQGIISPAEGSKPRRVLIKNSADKAAIALSTPGETTEDFFASEEDAFE